MEMPRSARIDGRATFTTVLSSMIMKSPNETAASVHHLRFSSLIRRAVTSVPARLAERRPGLPHEERSRERLRQPPVPAAGDGHDRRHEQGPDHGRVEDDPLREADPELLDVGPRAGRE